MAAEHFCSIVAVSIPFLLFEILITSVIVQLYWWEGNISHYLVFFVVVPNPYMLFWIQRTECYRFHEIVGLYLNAYKQIIVCICQFIEWKVYEFFTMWQLAVHNAFNCDLGSGHHSIICLCSCWLTAMPENCCLPSWWSAGGGFCLKEVISDNALGVMYNAYGWFVIRKTFCLFLKRGSPLSNCWRTFLFYSSELILLNESVFFRACVEWSKMRCLCCLWMKQRL